jgi:hypothetical protein
MMVSGVSLMSAHTFKRLTQGVHNGVFSISSNRAVFVQLCFLMYKNRNNCNEISTYGLAESAVLGSIDWRMVE